MHAITRQTKGLNEQIFSSKLPINRSEKGSLQLIGKGNSMLPIFGSKVTRKTVSDGREKGEKKLEKF